MRFKFSIRFNKPDFYRAKRFKSLSFDTSVTVEYEKKRIHSIEINLFFIKMYIWDDFCAIDEILKISAKDKILLTITEQLNELDQPWLDEDDDEIRAKIVEYKKLYEKVLNV